MVEINNLDELYDLITNDEFVEKFNIVYKPADALAKTDEKESEIAKDISAFANSEGGIIIYGIKEFNKISRNNFQKNIDPIDSVTFSKDWFENVINGNVFTHIENLYIKQIYLNSDKNDVVYIVIINKSYTAHQTSDYRYYKRSNFESIPMRDFEIRNVMNRSKTQKDKLDFEIQSPLPALQLFNDKDKRNTKKKKSSNALYVYGRDVDEYMQIMLAVI
ncbi:AlbA family DNA-binding domain-containing protein [Flavobacterium seoulense]|uniref:Schlafen AlbA-2 domain-containing protein n=1 Tax=Flavobacterium seoulense TaxID=1492738 RepID=A0A066WLF3_9FLAO|nr:ATP-binding protein [Flavobacterium seoulense]KDN54696.1 hypothetical protein FEM21_22100 [Flavobacterium seoulense]